MFRSFKFNVINDILGFKFAILLFVFCLFPLCFVPMFLLSCLPVGYLKTVVFHFNLKNFSKYIYLLCSLVVALWIIICLLNLPQSTNINILPLQVDCRNHTTIYVLLMSNIIFKTQEKHSLFPYLFRYSSFLIFQVCLFFPTSFLPFFLLASLPAFLAFF